MPRAANWMLSVAMRNGQAYPGGECGPCKSPRTRAMQRVLATDPRCYGSNCPLIEWDGVGVPSPGKPLPTWGTSTDEPQGQGEGNDMSNIDAAGATCPTGTCGLRKRSRMAGIVGEPRAMPMRGRAVNAGGMRGMAQPVPYYVNPMSVQTTRRVANVVEKPRYEEPAPAGGCGCRGACGCAGCAVPTPSPAPAPAGATADTSVEPQRRLIIDAERARFFGPAPAPTGDPQFDLLAQEQYWETSLAKMAAMAPDEAQRCRASLPTFFADEAAWAAWAYSPERAQCPLPPKRIGFPGGGGGGGGSTTPDPRDTNGDGIPDIDDADPRCTATIPESFPTEADKSAWISANPLCEGEALLRPIIPVGGSTRTTALNAREPEHNMPSRFVYYAGAAAALAALAVVVGVIAGLRSR